MLKEKENKIMGITMVLSLLSGVALFLYGMSLMGDSLKKVAGNKLELILYRLTNTPLKGLLLGTVVTAIIQSSSATTVMVVGFVNSGMMKVAQAIGIIMGANIGTSITGWILCLSYIDGSSGIAQLLSTATISAIVAIIGIIFRTFIKKKPYSDIGDIMLGFAILMIGMQTMSGAVSPLKENPHFVRLLTMFTNPFMGILVGIVFTAVLQSASASVGILQALSITGSITFAAALPITMGIGVGAACPVLLSSIGTNKNGKRTALIYLLNDLFGMIFWSIVFYSVNAIVHFPFMGEIMSPFRVALLNTVFRLLTILVLAPFIGKIEKLVFFLIKDTDEDNEEQADFDLLEERFLNYPPLAITQSQLAVNGMAKKAYKNIRRALALLKDFSDNKFNKIQEKENLIDKYEDKLGTYLMQLNMHDLTPEQSKQTAKFLHTISDFERLGDHAVNISRVAQELHEKSRIFSDAAKYELHVLESALKELLDLTINSFVDEDLVNAAKVEPLRELIGILCNDLKMRHIKRLRNGQCDLNTGFAFNDLLTNYDRIAAHCSNIAVAILELDSSNFDMHEYTKSVRKLKDNNYVSTFDYYEQKYNINGYQPEAEQDTKAAAKTRSKLLKPKNNLTTRKESAVMSSLNISSQAHIASQSVILGDVTIGADSSVFYYAVVRGDEASITIGRRSNIQDNSTVHVDYGFPTVIGDDVTVGHNCVIHGCTIGDASLIGMGSTILNGAKIGKHCLIGAGSLVTQNTVIPDGMLVIGSPAKVKRPLTEEEIQSIYKNAADYVTLSAAQFE